MPIAERILVFNVGPALVDELNAAPEEYRNLCLEFIDVVLYEMFTIGEESPNQLQQWLNEGCPMNATGHRIEQYKDIYECLCFMHAIRNAPTSHHIELTSRSELSLSSKKAFVKLFVDPRLNTVWNLSMSQNCYLVLLLHAPEQGPGDLVQLMESRRGPIDDFCMFWRGLTDIVRLNYYMKLWLAHKLRARTQLLVHSVRTYFHNLMHRYPWPPSVVLRVLHTLHNTGFRFDLYEHLHKSLHEEPGIHRLTMMFSFLHRERDFKRITETTATWHTLMETWARRAPECLAVARMYAYALLAFLETEEQWLQYISIPRAQRAASFLLRYFGPRYVGLLMQQGIYVFSDIALYSCVPPYWLHPKGCALCRLSLTCEPDESHVVCMRCHKVRVHLGCFLLCPSIMKCFNCGFKYIYVSRRPQE
jgi:hypothetical protein